MQREITGNLVIRGWLLLLLSMAVALLYTACQTSPIHDFSKVQLNMDKGDVLNIVGSPVRTERLDGKEKWAYRFYSSDPLASPTLRQVTFLNGRVFSFGEDTAEEERLKQMEDDDAKRLKKREQFKARALGSDGSVPAEAPNVTVKIDGQPVKPVIEEDFVEQPGKSAPVKQSEE